MGLAVNRFEFFKRYRANFGTVTQGQVDGITLLLDSYAVDNTVDPTDPATIPQTSYIFASTGWETAHTYKPIREYGKGSGKPYGVPVLLPSGRVVVYYGRGDVQLTWERNYMRMELRIGVPLHEFPDLALEHDVAYQVLTIGMREGFFECRAAGKSGIDLNPCKCGMHRPLSHWINDKKIDYLGARRTVNGTDNRDKIAAMAVKFQDCFERSVIAP